MGSTVAIVYFIETHAQEISHAHSDSLGFSHRDLMIRLGNVDFFVHEETKMVPSSWQHILSRKPETEYVESRSSIFGARIRCISRLFDNEVEAMFCDYKLLHMKSRW